MDFLFFFSVSKGSLTTLAAVGLFTRHTGFFSQPLSAQLRADFRLLSLLQVLLEDIPQLSILVAVQGTDISEWTDLNKVSAAISATAALVSLTYSSMKVCSKRCPGCCVSLFGVNLGPKICHRLAEKPRNIISTDSTAVESEMAIAKQLAL